MTTDLPPFVHRNRSVSAAVAAHFEKLIATGELAPGARLPAERELAASMSISRASLREAMHELENKQLIERRPGRGTIVTPRSSAELELLALSDGSTEADNAAELRYLVEPSVAGLAASRATAANLIQLREVLDQTHPGLKPQRSLELDIEFHLLVAQAARNPLITTLHTLTTEWTMEVRRHSHATERARRQSRDGHRAILDAIESRDPDAARSAMALHLDEVRVLIAQRNRDGEPDPA